MEDKIMTLQGPIEARVKAAQLVFTRIEELLMDEEGIPRLQEPRNQLSSDGKAFSFGNKPFSGFQGAQSQPSAPLSFQSSAFQAQQPSIQSQPSTPRGSSFQPQAQQAGSFQIGASSFQNTNSFQTQQPNTNSFQAPQPNTNSFQAPQPNTNSFQAPQPNGNSYQGQQSSGNSYQGQQSNGTSYQGQQPNGTSYQAPQSNTNSFQAPQPNGNSYQGQQSNGTSYQGQQPNGTSFQPQQPNLHSYQSSNSFQTDRNSFQSDTNAFQPSLQGFQQKVFSSIPDTPSVPSASHPIFTPAQSSANRADTLAPTGSEQAFMNAIHSSGMDPQVRLVLLLPLQMMKMLYEQGQVNEIASRAKCSIECEEAEGDCRVTLRGSAVQNSLAVLHLQEKLLLF